MTAIVVLLVFATLGSPGNGGAPPSGVDGSAGELDVLPGSLDGVAKGKLLYAALQREAGRLLDARRSAFEAVDSPAAARAWQERLRARFLGSLGGFPDRTPLNARTTRVRLRDGFRVENVIFDSRPGFPVTANLYLPDSAPPHPGVLVPCGHSQNGKEEEAYQLASMLLARNGIAALCFDPVGQGERKQFLTETGEPRFHATEEHMVLGSTQILLGHNLAQVMVWDAMRALDYLVSRPEIDPKRLGCSGNSGGGTQTSYLMALDERVACAAPSCYLTSFERLLATIGPQDAEQNLFGQLKLGLDHADYLLLRAPRPTLICAATRDFFDIGGTWDSFRQAKRFYGRLGHPERVDLVETDATHGFSRDLRVGMVQWMRRWLQNEHDALLEPALVADGERDVRCTPNGQVLRLPGTRTLMEIAREEEGRHAAARAVAWGERDAAGKRALVRRVAGVARLADLPALEVVSPDSPQGVEPVAEIARDGYRIDKLLLRGVLGIPIPALHFVPDQPTTETILAVAAIGKSADAAPGGRYEQEARAGRAVLAVDLAGLGETQHSGARGDYARHAGPNWPCVLLAYLCGRSMVRLRAEQILQCARHTETGAKKCTVSLHATGEVAPAALHAAALEPQLFAAVSIREATPISWAAVVQTDVPANAWIQVVHGALRHYDLPDLLELSPAGTEYHVD